MTNGPRQRGSAAASSGDAVSESGKESGGGVALKKEIGLVSACGIIVGKCQKSNIGMDNVSNNVHVYLQRQVCE